MVDLSARSTKEEIMDDLNISGDVIGTTLRELDTINRKLGGNAISLRALRRLLKRHSVQSLADLGCGGADILIAMAKVASAQGLNMELTGIDANPHIVDYAHAQTAGYQNIKVKCANVFETEFQSQSFDVIHCCLFLHHFSHDQLVELFRQFHRQAKVAIIVNDLHRHHLAYYSIQWLTRFFSRSFMVKNDASLSVARGFKKRELAQILREVGLSHFSIQWRWAFRWEVVVYTTDFSR